MEDPASPTAFPSTYRGKFKSKVNRRKVVPVIEDHDILGEESINLDMEVVNESVLEQSIDNPSMRPSTGNLTKTPLGKTPLGTSLYGKSQLRSSKFVVFEDSNDTPLNDTTRRKLGMMGLQSFRPTTGSSTSGQHRFAWLPQVVQGWLDEELPDERVIRVRLWFIFICCAQILFGAGMVTLVGLDKDRSVMAENLFPSALMVLVGCLGICASFFISEYYARVFFVLEMWLLSNLTLYLFRGMDDEMKSQALCMPVKGSFSQTTQCEYRPATQTKAALSYVSIFCVVLAATLARDFNDAINDAMADSVGVRAAGRGAVYEKMMKEVVGDDRGEQAMRPMTS
eukprot:PhF_6_TR19970/c0_g1_i2/m.29118